jgi:hypothetical protein
MELTQQDMQEALIECHAGLPSPPALLLPLLPTAARPARLPLRQDGAHSPRAEQAGRAGALHGGQEQYLGEVLAAGGECRSILSACIPQGRYGWLESYQYAHTSHHCAFKETSDKLQRLRREDGLETG